MERLTYKIVYDNEHYQYVFDYNQESEVKTKLGELEDVLEEFELTSAEDLRNYLNFKGNMAIWEGELNYKNKITDFEQELADLQHRLEVAEKALDKMANDWCLMDNPSKPSDVVKKYKEQTEKEIKGE